MGMRNWALAIVACTVLALSLVAASSLGGEEDDLLVEDDIEEPASVSPLPVTASETCCAGDVGSLLNANYILVSTMDGKVTALDVNSNGRVAWTRDTDSSPLLSGTLNSHQLMADGHPYLLVPSLDGSLYMFNMDSNALDPIPLNTGISVMVGEDAVAGGSIVSTTGVDPITGQVRYHCTSQKCAQMAASSRSPFTLIIRRNTQVARAADPITGCERWNLSVAEYSISLASSGRSSNNYFSEPTPSMVRFRLRPPDGVISAISSGGVPIWEQDLNSPIARVWHLFNGRINEISLFDSNNVEALEGLNYEDLHDTPRIEAPFYFGTVNSEPYIIPSTAAREDLRRFALTKETARFQPYGTDLAHYGRVLYLHDIALTTLIRRVHEDRERPVEPGSVSNYKGYRSCPMSNAALLAEGTELQRVGFGNEERRGDLGWYVFKSISRLKRNAGNSRLFFDERYQHNDNERDSGRYRTNIIERFGKKLNADEPVSGWWRVGALALCVMLVSMSSVIVIYIQHYRYKVHYASSTVSEDSIPRSSTKPSASSLATATTELSPDEDLMCGRKLSSHRSISTTASQAVPDPFLEDFIPEKLLGRGGYGVVFNCRHRLDDRSYAVKRIAVSDTTSAVERVKREAKAMAKLNHPGIIRYFHTWMERPPEGWQQAKDKEILKKIRALTDSVNPSLTRSSDGGFRLHSEESSSVEPAQRSKNLNNGRLSSLSCKMMPNGVTSVYSWQAKGAAEFMSSEALSDSWANDDQSASQNTACSSTDFDSSCEQSGPQLVPAIQSRGVNTESSGVVFENASCSEEDCVVGCTRRLSSNTSSGPLEPPAVLVVSETELHTCKKTKDYIYLYIQMEAVQSLQLCQELTLHNWLMVNNRKEDRQLDRMRNWLAQLVCAIDYIHDQGLIHRDLKPQNIFFSADGMNSLKIGDLGLATNYSAAETGEEMREGAIVSSSRHTSNVGTRLYMSPEQLKGGAYDQKIDVFSLGLIFTEMLIPFQTVMERNVTLSRLQSGILPKAHLVKFSSEVKFISWLTKPDACIRPSCREIMQSEYLRDELASLGMPFTRSCANFASRASEKCS
ncbi:Eukaryotic translation initiation factor 2-alpha kinase 3 [Toxocara canis]|uniref:PRKR-like endoplasmic reticulum kinase n=1 Tax=Toxocara canis TaxID=6265 RepID=A0A0B2VQ56_TOXCA|nr:Eukaryotic translation initiation factor 2-alpha kinase 3 [Toxocara canis]